MNNSNLVLSAGFLLASVISSSFSLLLQISLFGIGFSLFICSILGIDLK